MIICIGFKEPSGKLKKGGGGGGNKTFLGGRSLMSASTELLVGIWVVFVIVIVTITISLSK
jgi:hypothetical protein